MSQSTKAPCSANAAPLYAVQPQRTPARRRAGALLMGTALSAVIGLGYGRGAYAQDQGTLSGPNNQTVIRTGPGTFETQEGFSVTTTTGNGVDIDNRTYDPVSFVDANGSSITAYDRGVYVYGKGDVNISMSGDVRTTNALGVYGRSGYSGDVAISASGTVNAGAETGIYAYNFEDGAGAALSITANNVYGAFNGVAAYGYGDISVTTNEGGTVRGGDAGIEVVNAGNQYGTGQSINITTNGAIIGDAGNGIEAFNQADGDLRIEANTVTGGTYGIYADNDGSGALSITTTGTVRGTDDGIRAYNYGTNLTVSANAIQSTNAYGIFARNYGTGILKVETTGDVSASSDGIYAESEWSGSGPYPTDVIVSAAADVSSDYGTGIRVNNYGTGALSVTAIGAVTAYTGNGIYAYSAGVGAEDATDLNDNSLEGVSLAITANTVTGGTNGIFANNLGSGALSITANGAVTGGTDDGIYAYNASTEDLTITIAEGGSVSTSGTDTASDFAIQAAAPNGAVIVDNFGTVTGRVNLTNSNTFTNAGTWDLAGTTSDFNATGNSLVVNEGLIIAASDGEVNEWPWLDNLDTFRNNAGGTIRLADGGAGDVFEIGNSGGQASANFVANGGTVELDVVLGGDGSAADRLDISGDVILDEAPTALAINSVGGGAGDETTTGIEVVTVGGTSDAGAFVLAGPTEVGALSYDLSLGQCDDTANDNWYLCNNGTIGTTGAVFEAMPGVVLNSFARTETLQQRLGARVQGGTGPTLSTQGEADLPVAQSVGPWMRSWGDFADITPDNSTAGTSWEADSWGLEAGIGTILGDHAGGNLVGGVNLRYGATYADLSNPVGTASLNAEGFGMAASLTWFGNDGFYVDGNAAVDFVSIDATSQGGGELLNDHDDVVYSASAEVGKRIELQGGTTLVPQAQLSWGKMRDGSLTDNLGNVVSFADRETLTSRVGLTVEQDVTGSSWGAGKVFGFGNVLHDLEGSRTATVAGTDVTQSSTGDWLELGGGFSLQPTENSNVFGQVSYREAFNGVDGDAIAVSAGWRMQW